MRFQQTGNILFEKKRFWLSMVIPSLLIFILWLVEFIQFKFDVNLNQFGVTPLNLKGLSGVIASPLLHADYKHLWSNTIPLWVFLFALFYYYPKVAWKVIIIIWLGDGLCVWLFGYGGTHIGASGLVYGLAAFHFTQGFLQKNVSITAFMLLEIFLFGGMIWGIFPEFFPEKNISWESHLFGMIIGVVLAIIYRNDGPETVKFSWESEDDENENPDKIFNPETDNKPEEKNDDENLSKTSNIANIVNEEIFPSYDKNRDIPKDSKNPEEINIKYNHHSTSNMMK